MYVYIQCMHVWIIYRLPGKAYAKRQHIWLTGANEVESKVFSRAILAKVPHNTHTHTHTDQTNTHYNKMLKYLWILLINFLIQYMYACVYV